MGTRVAQSLTRFSTPHTTQAEGICNPRPHHKSLIVRNGQKHCGDTGAGNLALTAEISGDYAGLLQLITGQNEFGGGQGIQLSLGPLLRFEIHGVAFAA